MPELYCCLLLPQAGDALEPAWREEADRRPELAEQDHVNHTVGSCTHGPAAHASTTSGEKRQLKRTAETPSRARCMKGKVLKIELKGR